MVVRWDGQLLDSSPGSTRATAPQSILALCFPLAPFVATALSPIPFKINLGMFALEQRFAFHRAPTWVLLHLFIPIVL